MSRLAIIAAAAIYTGSLAGLATMPLTPDLPHPQADQRSAITLIATEDRSICRVGAELDAPAAGQVVVADVGPTA